MSGDPAIQLTFSIEEVILLMKLLRTDEMLGLSLEEFETLPDEQQQLLMGSAQRSLQARGLLQIQEQEGLAVERTLLALLMPCLRPESVAFVGYSGFDGTTQGYSFYYGNEFLIGRWPPSAGLHSFAAYPSATDAVEISANLLKLNGANVAEPLNLRLTVDQYAGLLERMASEHRSGLDSVFAPTSLSARERKRIVDLLEASSGTASFVFAEISDGKASIRETWTLFISGETILQSVPVESTEHGRHMRMALVSGADLQDKLVSLFSDMRPAVRT